jgi:formylglycine-generating enzyme required for sulfatase activity/membrane-bound inhibitor of C-type lysozyme
VEEGFKIDRKDGTGAWQLNYATVGANTALYTIDLSGTIPEEIYIHWRIRAYNQGYYSAYSNEALLEPNTVAAPVAVPTGATYNNAQSVLLSTVTNGATVKYTMDNSDPTVASANYTTPIPVNKTATIKAKAFKNGWKSSTLCMESYNMVVANPVISVPGGAYLAEQTVSISCATLGATIRYTTNGSEPNSTSPQYNNPVVISGNATLKAKALKAGWTESSTVSESYSFTVATPTFNPPGGAYYNTQNVTLSCSTIGATIRYTTNGSEPISTSTLYGKPIVISGITSLKAKAFKADWTESSTSSASYSLNVAAPIFDPAEGVYNSAQNVSISCSTIGATIRYTANGSEPNATSTQYSNPIVISGNTSLKAKAFKSDWTASVTVTASYNIIPSDFVTIAGGSFNNGTSNVTVSSFYMDKCELTQAGYQAVMGTNPASGYGFGSNYPVYYVTWFNAIEYCNRRSISEGRTPCYSYSTYGTNPDNWPTGCFTDPNNHTNVSCNWTAIGYRLPTEAEWQFAARGGNLTHDYTYSGSNDVSAVAWYNDNSGGTTYPVGTKPPNELGLFDMTGNVWEWTWDIFGNYNSGVQTNPHGTTVGSYRVFRGGAWNISAIYCPVSIRNYASATGSYSYIGFRCVVPIP